MPITDCNLILKQNTPIRPSIEGVPGDYITILGHVVHFPPKTYPINGTYSDSRGDFYLIKGKLFNIETNVFVQASNDPAIMDKDCPQSVPHGGGKGPAYVYGPTPSTAHLAPGQSSTTQTPGSVIAVSPTNVPVYGVGSTPEAAQQDYHDKVELQDTIAAYEAEHGAGSWSAAGGPGGPPGISAWMIGAGVLVAGILLLKK